VGSLATISTFDLASENLRLSKLRRSMGNGSSVRGADGPKIPRSTVLSGEEEALAIAFRKRQRAK
jgi:hypothetical protein